MDGWRDPLQALKAYETWLARQPLSSRTRGEYVRWVRLFCGWLQDGADERALGADPLADLPSLPSSCETVCRTFLLCLRARTEVWSDAGEHE